MFTSIRFLVVLCCAAGSAFTLNAQQLITGSATITLSGPASKEINLQAETEARKQFRKELLDWISDDAELSIDTTNAIQRKSFSTFVDSCRSVAKSESAFKGKVLTLTYMLTSEQARAKLDEYNSVVDTRATEGWKRLQGAVAENDNKAIYTTGVSTLFYALAHLGPPVATPESEGRDLADDIRQILQQLFNKMQVSSSGMILEGKTGLLIQNPPVITVLVDSVPFTDITFSGSLQNGAILFTSASDAKGQIAIGTMKVPFVPNGTLLEASPNFAPQLGITGFVNPSHFGLKLNNSQVQTFIFKVSKSIYTLDFKASSVSDITLPPDFANAQHIKKYLQDSCYLQEGTGAGTDLSITITTQVSSYTYDATEEVGIKVTSQIIVNGLLLTPQRTNKQDFVFEKRYGRYLTPPYGLYFWEATGKLREAIKTTIAGL